MAENFQAAEICSGGNYWNNSWKSMYTAAGLSLSPCSTAVNDHMASISCNESWPNYSDHFSDMKAVRSCQDQSTDSLSDSSLIFHDNRKTQNSSDSASGGCDSNILIDSPLQIMGFGVSSSPTSVWNQNLLDGRRADDHENNFDSLLGGHMGTDHDDQLVGYKQEIMNPKYFKPAINDHQDFFSLGSNTSSTTTSYGYSSTLLQTLFDSDDHDPQSSKQSLLNNRSIHCSYGSNSNDVSSPPSSSSWLHPSLTKQQSTGLRFSNINTPFWNSSNSDHLFSPSSNSQFSQSIVEEKPISCHNFNSTVNSYDEDHQDSGSPVKRISNRSSDDHVGLKRTRIVAPSPLPTFKVRKEKLGDRVTALQQLVSPFGKTDTASVLQEAIEYIKFLHDQLSALSTPYMKSPPIKPQQGLKSSQLKDPDQGPKQDLRSRGLCLIPISSTFPVANEPTTPDFWTPTFGGTLR